MEMHEFNKQELPLPDGQVIEFRTYIGCHHFMALVSTFQVMSYTIINSRDCHTCPVP